MIILTTIQMFSAFTGFATFALRRNLINFGIHCLALTTGLIGLIGAARLDSKYSFIHCTTTTGVVGSFFVYEVISAIFRRDNHLNETHISETWMLLLLSVLYLLDLAVGIYGCIFSMNLLEPEKQEESDKLENDFESELQHFQRNTDGNNLCCICMDSPKNCAFIPCGHECTCYECASDYLERRPYNQKKCIICRENLKGLAKVYLCYLKRILKE